MHRDFIGLARTLSPLRCEGYNIFDGEAPRLASDLNVVSLLGLAVKNDYLHFTATVKS